MSNNPRQRDGPFAYLVSGAVGLGIWAVFNVLSQGAEVWDSAVYWKAGLPTFFAANAVLGYIWPQQPWRWSLVLVGVQSSLIFVPGLVRGFAPLLPVGLCFTLGLCVLSAPFAYAGAALRILRR